MKVCVISHDIQLKDPEKNRILLYNRIASYPTNDLYVLPEFFTTGFIPNPDEYAEDMFGETI